ncbi:hypothetical protein D3C85_1805920 [compost metagenome]
MAINEASELMRVRVKVSAQAARASRAAGGYRPSSMPAAVATPLPPLKRKYSG